MRRRRGHTVIEVLVTGVLFLMVLIMCGELAIRGMRIKTQTEDKNQAFRTATIALDQLNRDLLHCDAVLLPAAPVADDTPLQPGVGNEKPLVIRSNPVGAGPASVIGYRYDPAGQTLVRLLYQPDFDPVDVGKQNLLPKEPPKVVANWLADFRIQFRHPRWAYGQRMVQTDVTVRTSPESNSPTLRLTTRSGLRNP